MSYVAKNLLFLRKQKGATQAETCASIGVPRNTYSNWENDVSTPDLGTLISLAKYFDVDLNDFLLSDMSEVKLIKNEKHPKNSPKGKVNGKLNGKPNAQNAEVTGIVEEPGSSYGNPPVTPQNTAQIISLKDQIIHSKDITITSLQTALTLAQAEIARLKKGQ